MGGESVLLLWVVKVCHYIRVVKISGEKMNGGQKKLGGTFQGGKKVAAYLIPSILCFSRLFDLKLIKSKNNNKPTFRTTSALYARGQKMILTNHNYK